MLRVCPAGVVLERIDEQTLRYTSCNTGAGLGFHGGSKAYEWLPAAWDQ